MIAVALGSVIVLVVMAALGDRLRAARGLAESAERLGRRGR